MAATRSTVQRTARAVAGPLLIVASVLLVLHGFVFGGRLSAQHPDILAYWLPTYCTLGKALAAGHVPVWNPAVMGGVPFAADPQSGWMYLSAMTLFTTLPCATAMGWMIALQPLLAGLGLYGFARSEGLSRSAATTGGLAIALPLAASRLALFLPFPSAFAWTIVALLACSRLFHARTWSGRLLWILLTALAWGQLVEAHSGHGGIIGTSALVVFVAVKTWSALRGGALTARTAGATLGALLASLPLVNLAVLLPRVAYLGETSYGPAYAHAAQLTWLPAAWPLKFATVPGTYLGAAALVLSFAAFRSRRHRSLAVAFGAWGAVAYTASLHGVTRVVGLALAHVPVLNFYQHYPGRFGMALFVAVPVLAAIGAQAWIDAMSWRERWTMLVPGALVWLAGPAALGAPARQLALPAAGAIGGGLALWFVARRGPGRGLAAAIPVVVAVELVVAGLVGQADRPFGLHRLAARDPFGANATGWTVGLRRPSVDGGAYLATTPISRELAAAGGRYLSLNPPILSHRGYLDRQAPRDWGLLANQRAMLLGLEDAQGYNPFQLDRYWMFVRAVDRLPIDYNAGVLSAPSLGTLHLFDARWIVGPSSRPPLPGLAPSVRDGLWTLYRVPGPAARVELFKSWTVVGSPGRSLATVTSGGFDADRSLVLERGPGVPRPRPGGGSPTGVRLVRTSPSSVSFTVDAATPSVAVVKQSYERHWRATVDGRAVPLLHADFLMDGVPVPAGHHVIRLADRDPTIALGVLGSFLTIVTLLGGALALRWLKRSS